MGRLAFAAVIPYVIVAGAIISFLIIAAMRAVRRARTRSSNSASSSTRVSPHDT